MCIQETKVVEITTGMVTSCIFFGGGGGGGVCGEGSSLGDTPFHVCFKMWRIALDSCSWECMVQMMIKSRWICGINSKRR